MHMHADAEPNEKMRLREATALSWQVASQTAYWES